MFLCVGRLAQVTTTAVPFIGDNVPLQFLSWIAARTGLVEFVTRWSSQKVV